MSDQHNDADWDSALDRARSTLGTRGLLLLAVALCRRIGDRFPCDDCLRAVEAVERLAADPRVSGEDYSVATEVDAAVERLQQGYGSVHELAPRPRGAYLAATTCAAMWHDPTGLLGDVATAAAIAATGCAEGPEWDAERRAQTALFREFVSRGDL